MSLNNEPKKGKVDPVKSTLLRTKRERIVFIFCIFVLIFTLFYVLSHDRHTRKEDVNGDGLDETIREIRFANGTIVKEIEYSDDTIETETYNDQGELVIRQKTDPEGNHFVWDEETEQWLPDQNQNGIPDEREYPHVFGVLFNTNSDILLLRLLHV